MGVVENSLGIVAQMMGDANGAAKHYRAAGSARLPHSRRRGAFTGFGGAGVRCETLERKESFRELYRLLIHPARHLLPARLDAPQRYLVIADPPAAPPLPDGRRCRSWLGRARRAV
jgi:hypothetical protein